MIAGFASPRTAIRRLLDHCGRGWWVLLLLGELAFLTTPHAQDLARQIDPPIPASAWAVTIGLAACVALLQLLAALLGAHFAGRLLGGVARFRETAVALACGGVPVVLCLLAGVGLGVFDLDVSTFRAGIEIGVLFVCAILAAAVLAEAQRSPWAGGACAVFAAAVLALAVQIIVYPIVYSWFPGIATGPVFGT